jgi:isoleucyl-tRNA synthetase
VREVFERDGSDAMRWFLMSSPILRGGNLVVTEESIRDAVRHVMLPLWNTWSFFALYANAAAGGAGFDARRITGRDAGDLGQLDRYILARTRDLVTRMTATMDAFDIPDACEAVREYLDVLTNWYVRRSRDRFWVEDAAAFNTLYTALEVVARLIAPLAPLVAEEIWRGLTGSRSVHLADWPDVSDGAPDATALPAARDLVEAMDRTREVCSVALSLRKARGLRVRQPLRALTILAPDPEDLEPFAQLIADEVNVREVTVAALTDDGAAHLGVVTRLDVNARAAGPRLGRGVQSVIRAAKAGAWEDRDGSVIVHTPESDVPLEPGEYTTTTAMSGEGADDRAAGMLAGGGFAVLDTWLDEDLIAEGYARDMIRLVQDTRKATGLEVTDRIDLVLAVPPARRPAVEAHAALIAAETLATTLTIAESPSDDPVATLKRTRR